MSVTVGIDEVGRGCWAGPLVVAAVILYKPVLGLADSKLLSRLQREKLAAIIKENARIGIGWISAKEIDKIGLTAGTARAMHDAISQITEEYDEIIIDGNLNYLPEFAHVSMLPKADSLVPAVSAASIIAKVARDNYMRSIALEFPLYEFDKHVGYGTKLHHEMLKLHGVCELHRLTYKPVRALL